MGITSNGLVSMSALRTEYKDGSGAVSMSQLNRGGGHVPTGGARNSAIPTTDNNLAFSKYRNTSKTVSVGYEIIGAGGAGGFGVSDGGSNFKGTFGTTGGSSDIKDGSTTLVTAPGGRGGENCGGPKGTAGTAGQSSHYGPGGAGGARNSAGLNASGFGAGGGGGGGDNGSTYDEGGHSGGGGRAATRLTGSLTLSYDTQVTLKAAVGSAGAGSVFRAGSGKSGYVRITWDGKSQSAASSTEVYTIN